MVPVVVGRGGEGGRGRGGGDGAVRDEPLEDGAGGKRREIARVGGGGAGHGVGVPGLLKARSGGAVDEKEVVDRAAGDGGGDGRELARADGGGRSRDLQRVRAEGNAECGMRGRGGR